MHLLDDFQNEARPVPNDVQGSLCVVEEWNVEDATVLTNEIVQVDPFILVDLLVDDVDFFVVNAQADLLFEFTNVLKDVQF